MPTETENPENYIMGGSCDNLGIPIAQSDPRYFKIIPRPLRLWGLFIISAIWIAATIALFFFLKQRNPDPLLRFSVSAISLATDLGLCLIIYLRYKSEHHKGEWLIYDKTEKLLSLPRAKTSFTANEIICIQYVTSGLMHRGITDNPQRSELNLIIHQNGERLRINILRALSPSLDNLARPLKEQTPLPIIRSKESHSFLMKRQISVTDYNG